MLTALAPLLGCGLMLVASIVVIVVAGDRGRPNGAEFATVRAEVARRHRGTAAEPPRRHTTTP